MVPPSCPPPLTRLFYISLCFFLCCLSRAQAVAFTFPALCFQKHLQSNSTYLLFRIAASDCSVCSCVSDTQALGYLNDLKFMLMLFVLSVSASVSVLSRGSLPAYHYQSLLDTKSTQIHPVHMILLHLINLLPVATSCI